MSDVPEIQHTKHTLANGLQVILHEDHGLPIVAVNLWYHVGSKNEERGRTGFAHLFEHLMFEGSEHYDKGYFEPLQEAGGLLNGSTNPDRTNYWEVVPVSALERALWMESDRMGHLLPALTEKKFNNQRDVVLNERRQNYENRPYGLASFAIVSALFGPAHPYGWPTIGWPQDLIDARLQDVQQFFATYYHPANASLALAGHIEPDRALERVAAYFGAIPPGPAVARVRDVEGDDPPRQRRLLLEDRVELPRIYLAWRSPALFAEGDAQLDLGADILANGKSSRLYRELVYERRIATEVAAAQNSREIGSYFQIIATAAPGRSLSELAERILAAVDRFRADGPSEDEAERAVAQAEAHFVYRLQTVGGFGGRSDQLNAYNVFTGDPGYFSEDLRRYVTTTADSLRRAAAPLTPDAALTLSVVPRGRLDLALPGSVPAEVV